MKIIMVTALDDVKSVFKAYSKGGAMSYLVKPIEKQKVLGKVRKPELID